MQKQSSEGFLKKSVMRNFAKFTRKHVCRNLFFDKVKHCRSATSLKTRFYRRCILVSFLKFVRTPFFAEHHRTTASEARIGKRNFKLMINYDKSFADVLKNFCVGVSVLYIFYYIFCYEKNTPTQVLPCEIYEIF